jgi:hypothetical protein
MPTGNQGTIFGYAYPTAASYSCMLTGGSYTEKGACHWRMGARSLDTHAQRPGCTIGKSYPAPWEGKEPFSDTRADEKASCREIESVHRKPEHDLWLRVPNGYNTQPVPADKRAMQRVKRAILQHRC